MREFEPKIKLSFIQGLKEVVLLEIRTKTDFKIIEETKDSVYIDFTENFDDLVKLRSVARAYVVLRGQKFNPLYVSNHKSVLSDLVEWVLAKNKPGEFKTYKVTCAGSDSKEVNEINEYIESKFKLTKENEADLKIHIVKNDDTWEVGLQVTARPLSLREYKTRNMSGAMDPTIAFSLNYLTVTKNTKTYLNIFSGSGTLLIEAAQYFPNLEKLLGFDINKEHLSLSIQNIKQAGLIKKVQVKEADIFSEPDFGKFDVIVSDLPFGMAISKNEDLEKLYSKFVEYSISHLNPKGKLAVFTSQDEIFEKVAKLSYLKIKKKLDIKIITSEDQYLPTKIFILE